MKKVLTGCLVVIRMRPVFKQFDEVRQNCQKIPRDGAIAQLGERLHGMQEVDGSIPSSSTKISSNSP